MQLTQIQKNKIRKVGKEFNLKLILLYGSYAKGNPRAGSDIDIVLLGKKPIEFDKQLKISSALEGILGDNNLAGELDISSFHKDDPLFRYEVTKCSKLLYGSEFDYSEFRAYAFQSYFDARDLFRLQQKLINKYQDYLMNTYAK